MTNVVPFPPKVVLPPIVNNISFTDTYYKITLIDMIINQSETIFDIRNKDLTLMKEALSVVRGVFGLVRGLVPLGNGLSASFLFENGMLMRWLFQTTIDEISIYINDIPSSLITAYVVDGCTMRDILMFLKSRIDNYVMISVVYQYILERAKANDIMQEFCNAIGDELFASDELSDMYLEWSVKLTEMIKNHHYDILMKTAKERYCLPENKI